MDTNRGNDPTLVSPIPYLFPHLGSELLEGEPCLLIFRSPESGLMAGIHGPLICSCRMKGRKPAELWGHGRSLYEKARPPVATQPLLQVTPQSRGLCGWRGEREKMASSWGPGRVPSEDDRRAGPTGNKGMASAPRRIGFRSRSPHLPALNHPGGMLGPVNTGASP